MRIAAMILPLLLAGCATAGMEPLPPPSATYRALGTEPFWSMTIADGRMTYAAADGLGFSVPAPARRPDQNGYRYETRRLTLAITHRQCSDGMSDRTYPDTVTAIVDGRSLRGCGGAPTAPANLAGTTWSMVAIDGDAVSGDTYALRFTADRIGGRAGCNSFGGTYRVEGDRLIPGPLISTRMACLDGDRMTHERNAMRVLGGPVRIGHPDGDTMVLSGNGGEIRLRRAI